MTNQRSFLIAVAATALVVLAAITVYWWRETLACQPCNQRKGTRGIEEFLKHKPDMLWGILAQAKAPLKDAAAVNATRRALFQALKRTGMDVETGSGGRTKWNRTRLAIPKTHALDAACVGKIDGLHDWRRPTLDIKATGRGAYQRTRLTAHGFPRGYLMRQKQVKGFATGSRVTALAGGALSLPGVNAEVSRGEN